MKLIKLNRTRLVLCFLFFIAINSKIFSQKDLTKIFSDFFNDMPMSSEKELKENFTLNTIEIFELKRYINRVVPIGYEVYIEFKENNRIDLRITEWNENSRRKEGLFAEWDIDPFNYKKEPNSDVPSPGGLIQTLSFEKVITTLKWNFNTFKTIKEKLLRANCISVTNGEPTQIGFKRSGMGMYFYNIFDKLINSNYQKQLDAQCNFRNFTKNILLEYYGGAIGPQCFPDK